MDRIRIVLFGLNYSNTEKFELFVATLNQVIHTLNDLLQNPCYKTSTNPSMIYGRPFNFKNPVTNSSKG